MSAAVAIGKTEHVFETAGLGKAPFRFVDIVVKRGPLEIAPGHFVGAPGQPVGSCAFCGNGIAECCVIQDAEGKRFEVGNVCVSKTGDRGLIDPIKQQLREAKRIAKAAKDSARIEAARLLYDQEQRIRETLSTYPHPNAFFAEQGHTEASYVEWMLQNAGNSGQVAAARRIEQVAKSLKIEGNQTTAG